MLRERCPTGLLSDTNRRSDYSRGCQKQPGLAVIYQIFMIDGTRRETAKQREGFPNGNSLSLTGAGNCLPFGDKGQQTDYMMLGCASVMVFDHVECLWTRSVCLAASAIYRLSYYNHTQKHVLISQQFLQRVERQHYFVKVKRVTRRDRHVRL